MKEPKRSNRREKKVSRRSFLKGAALASTALALPSRDADASIWEAFFQKHFHEMNEKELKKVIERLEREYGEKYGMDQKAPPGGPVRLRP